jgi:fatty acid desaturase
MAPDPSSLPRGTANRFVGEDARPVPGWRGELRRIPTVRNVLATANPWAQTAALVWLAARIPHPLLWLGIVAAMGAVHARFAALMHEAAHRLLFSARRVNDAVGRWLLGYPQMTDTDAYRRVHMAHHRAEFGPDEPDLALYANYPVTAASMRRKLLRDATGRTGGRLLRDQFAAARGGDRRRRRTLIRMTAVQIALAVAVTAGGAVAAGGFDRAHVWVLYPVVWVVPHLTVWRVINRLRSIAEHGGMRADPDRRVTTHSVRQHLLARAVLVPCNIGFHLAHHLDPGLPYRALPRYHRQLRLSGHVDDSFEHGSYRDLWRALAGRAG